MTPAADLSIDREACCGHGRCYAIAPSLFEPDDDEGRSRVAAQPTGDQLDTARRAAQNCPEQAITLDVLIAGTKESA